MDLTGKLEIAGKTDPGLIREHNEDKIGEDLELGTIVLADGMGGYQGGEVASAIAVNTILNYLHQHLPKLKPSRKDKSSGITQECNLAKNAIELANAEIVKISASQPQFRGMGTTIVLGIFYDNKLAAAHVGDSRMYRFRNSKLELITKDHTLLQELVDRGFYSLEEAQQSLNKNLVTRALGIDTNVMVDIRETEVEPNDIYLLCSDGLNDMISDDEIHEMLESGKGNLQATADSLIEAANLNGGKDNVSVILTRALTEFPAPPRRWYEKISEHFVN